MDFQYLTLPWLEHDLLGRTAAELAPEGPYNPRLTDKHIFIMQ